MKNKIKTVCVVPLCGVGSRFYKNGYSLPKPLIITKSGEPIIDCTMKTLKYIPYDYLVFVVMNTMTKKYLTGIYKNAYVVQPDKITLGGSHSVLLGLQGIQNNINDMQDFHLIVMDGDNFLQPKNIEYNSDIELFGFDDKTNSDRWARVVIDNKNKVTKIVEKKLLKDSIPLLGLFAFKSGKKFIEIAQEIILEMKVLGRTEEIFISDVVERFLSLDEVIQLQIIKNYKHFGIPSDIT